MILRISVIMIALYMASTVMAEPGRPVIRGGTLYASDGKKIRGSMRNVYNAPNNYTYVTADDLYKEAADFKLNAIRFWIRRQYTSSGALNTATYGSYPMDQLLPMMDIAVNQCAKFGFYAVIDCHVLNGKTGATEMNDAKSFWKSIAPRYKDRPHVIYELFNEPTYGAGMSADGIAKMVDLYKYVRAMAPKTHLITFSMGKFSYSSTIEATLDKTVGIDWSNASVGFHTYGMNSTTGVTSMQNAMKKYPMIMTEMGNESQIPLFEKAGVAFIGWGKGDIKNVTWGGNTPPPPLPDGNAKPMVSFASPSSNATVPAGTAVKVSVKASDPDGSVSKVTLLVDARNMGSKTAAPFEWNVTGLSAGQYTLTATVTDNKGASTEAMVDFTVGSATRVQRDAARHITPAASGFIPAIGHRRFALDYRDDETWRALNVDGRQVEIRRTTRR